MKIFSLILIAFLALSNRTYAQWNGFDIYIHSTQWYEKTNAYAQQANIKNLMVMTQGSITPSHAEDMTVAPDRVRKFMEKFYPGVDNDGIVVLDWESNVLKWIRDYPETHENFKFAEKQWVTLINEVRKIRPNVKIGMYGFPIRGFNDKQKYGWNKPGALDNLISKVDIICPSVYIGYTDEQRGRKFNEDYLKDMIDISFVYAKRHNKVVIPFVWHRILAGNKTFPRGILQNDTYSDYIQFIKNYSNDGFKVSGVAMWDDGFPEPRLKNLEGVSNWLKGSVKDIPTYDEYTLSMMKSVVNKLNSDN